MDSCADSDDDSSSISTSSSDVSFIEDLCIASIALSHRVNWLIVILMNCHCHMESLLHENLFDIKYQISTGSFNKLSNLLYPTLQLNDKYAVMTGMELIF
jgi:hypothetical protein